MRIFNTFQELWNYCLFCPICREPSRTISLQVGPDGEFELSRNIPFEKEGSQLKIYCTSFNSKRLKKFAATFIVDCDKNRFTVECSDPRAEHSYFYCYIHATCDKCNSSYVNTADLEFNRDNKISGIQMEREDFFVSSGNETYHVMEIHNDDKIAVYRVDETDDRTDAGENALKLPFFNLDFSDKSKLVNKIKTFILFS